MINNFTLFVLLISIFSGCAGKNSLSGALEKEVGDTNYPRDGFSKFFNFELPKESKEAFYSLPQNSSTVMLKIPFNENISYIKISDKGPLNINKIIPYVASMDDMTAVKGQDIYYKKDEDRKLYVKLYVPLIYTYKRTFSPMLTIAYYTATDIDTIKTKNIRLHFSYRSYHVTTDLESTQEKPQYDTYEKYSDNVEETTIFENQKKIINQSRISLGYLK